MIPAASSKNSWWVPPSCSRIGVWVEDKRGAFVLYSNYTSRPYLRWLVLGYSTYCHVRFAASIIAAWISSLIWNWNYSSEIVR